MTEDKAKTSQAKLRSMHSRWIVAYVMQIQLP